MEPIQGVVIMLALLTLALAPAAVQRARQRDRAAKFPVTAGELPVVMSAEQALARHMYGEAYGWSKLDLLEYDHLPFVREPWERSAQARLERTS